ncbi:MAG: hypothetical protein KC636_20945, partial [Myxococcales bacterium]|nr:hypothetical protein [Myxococcales bacterium]
MSHRARHLHHRLATFGAAALLAACALLPACGQQSAEDKVGAAEPASVRHSGEEGKMGKPSSRQKSGLYAMKGPRDGVPQHAHGDTKAEEREAEPSAPP